MIKHIYLEKRKHIQNLFQTIEESLRLTLSVILVSGPVYNQFHLVNLHYQVS